MPQVASETKAHALRMPLPQSARQTYASDRAAVTPFDSLLDNAPAPEPRAQAPEPRTQKASDDQAPRADRSQPKPANAADKPDRVAKSDDNAKPADTDAPADSVADATQSATKSASDDKSDADAAIAKTAKKIAEKIGEKIVEEAAAGDNVKTASDDAKPTGDTTSTDESKSADEDKSTDAATPVNLVSSSVPAPTQAVTGTDAAAVTPIAAPVATSDTAPPAQIADTKTTIEAAGAQTPKPPQPEVLDALQAKSDETGKSDKGDKSEKTAEKTATEKPTADVKTSTAAPPKFDPDAKVQATTGEPHKNAAAQLHAEVAANANRSAGKEDAAKASTDNKAATPKPAADIAQPATLNAPAQTAAAQAQMQVQASAPAAAPATATPAAPAAVSVPMAGVPIEITSKALSGNNSFDIRLDPPELGRIHVHLNVDRHGNVISHMVADRTDTLDMLRRDTASLERALQDAGLKTSDNSLQFSLRDQSANQQQNNSGTNTAQIVVEDESLVSADATSRDYVRYGARAGGVDISV